MRWCLPKSPPPLSPTAYSLLPLSSSRCVKGSSQSTPPTSYKRTNYIQQTCSRVHFFRKGGKRVYRTIYMHVMLDCTLLSLVNELWRNGYEKKTTEGQEAAVHSSVATVLSICGPWTAAGPKTIVRVCLLLLLLFLSNQAPDYTESLPILRNDRTIFSKIYSLPFFFDVYNFVLS